MRGQFEARFAVTRVGVELERHATQTNRPRHLFESYKRSFGSLELGSLSSSLDYFVELAELLL